MLVMVDIYGGSDVMMAGELPGEMAADDGVAQASFFRFKSSAAGPLNHHSRHRVTT